jgi:hypothetical protein
MADEEKIFADFKKCVKAQGRLGRRQNWYEQGCRSVSGNAEAVILWGRAL